MNLENWLDRIGRVHPKAWDLGLDRVASVGERLDILKPARQVFLVAGTNGKGSACEALEQLCLNHGYSVGKSTSPHLVRFNERIVVNGVNADDETICEAFDAIDEARGDTSLTYFEFATLAALLVFKRRNLDVAVLEVGLGGRLDAMNIVDPDVSIITRIALDHEAWLGNDRNAIGQEKAGIMRPGKFCIIADESPPASIAEMARATGAMPVYLGNPSTGGDFGINTDEIHLKAFGVLPGPMVPVLPLPSLLAALQAFALALAPPTVADVRTLSQLTLSGRFQMIEGSPTTLLDVAHNPDAAERLKAQLDAITFDRCRAVFGMYRDKAIDKVASTLSAHVDEWFLSAVNEDRAASPAELAAVICSFGGSVAGTYDKVTIAYDKAFDQSDAGDLILVFGSFPVVGEVLRHKGISV